MIKLIKYLKPFAFGILLSIGLLYLQASADLALPDYMSNIVNYGIQQNGFDRAIVQAIDEETFEKMLLNLSTEEQESFKAHYVLKTSEASRQLLEKDYPRLPEGNYYHLIQKEGIGLDQMERLTLKAFRVENNALMGLAMTSKYGESIGLDVQRHQRRYILNMGGLMLLIALLGAVASIVVGFIASKIAAGLGRNLRALVFEKVSTFSNFEMDRFSTASLITRSTNDISQVQTLMVMMIRMLFYAPIIGVGGIIRALDRSASMSWVIAVAVIVLMGIIGVIFVIAMPKFKAIQKMVDGLNRIVREQLSGMMVVRAFNTQKFEESRFDVANDSLTQTNLFVNRIMVFLFPAMTLVMNGVTLIIVWLGAKQIEASAMQVGDMMAFMQYALQIIFAFLMLSMMFIMIPRASVSAQRVVEILDEPLTIKDVSNPVPPKATGQGEVIFENVTFKYPGAEEPVLKNISFSAKAGQTTAIIGATGSGKSSLLNLIPRFYEPTQGEIRIDGVPIKLMPQDALRKMLGLVPQKATLFTGTIKSNVAFGKETLSKEEVEGAIDTAQAKGIVEEKTEGYDAPISQMGANVSGGQKQRLSIARALARNPKILIFDDSFSALDFKTEAKLRQALLKKKQTQILVSQRVSTIKHADQILVLDEGELVGVGTHDDLMNTCQVYKEIAMSQLSLEELS